MIFLDTNVVISILNNRPARFGDRLVETVESGEVVLISSIVVFELWYGVFKSVQRDRNQERIESFLDTSVVSVAPFDDADARVAGRIREALRVNGTPIGPYDLLIAGQALRHGAALVMANAREFSRVPGLAIQDWSIG